MSEPTPRVEVVISVPEDTALLSVRLMRGGRLVHEFNEPEPLPPNPPAPEGDAA